MQTATTIPMLTKILMPPVACSSSYLRTGQAVARLSHSIYYVINERPAVLAPASVYYVINEQPAVPAPASVYYVINEQPAGPAPTSVYYVINEQDTIRGYVPTHLVGAKDHDDLTIRCINFSSPPGGRKRQKYRPHTRPPRNPRGFLLGTQKTNFARLGQPGSDGRSAFGACK